MTEQKEVDKSGNKITEVNHKMFEAAQRQTDSSSNVYVDRGRGGRRGRGNDF